MAHAYHSARTPAYLQTAVEYRDRLKAELAKVETFIRLAQQSTTPDVADFNPFPLDGLMELGTLR